MSTISSARENKDALTEQLQAQSEQRKRLQEEHEQEMERLKTAYETEKAANVDRFETSAQHEKLQHYDNLRKIKKQTESEESNLSQRGQQRASQVQEQYHREISEATKEGESKLLAERKKHAAALEYQNDSARSEQELAKRNFSQNSELIQRDAEEKLNSFALAKENAVNTERGRTAEAVGQIQNHFENQRNESQNQYQNSLKNLQASTQADLDARRLGNAQKLEEYSKRQNDPFYQMVRFDNELSQDEASYRFRIKVPPHERDRFRVQIVGQEMQVSGVRSSNEKTEIAPGHWVSTASFQNFSETLPLDFPVDPKTLTSQTQGDWIEFSVLKYGPQHRELSQNLGARRDAKVPITEPDFPKTLPQASIQPRITQKKPPTV